MFNFGDNVDRVTVDKVERASNSRLSTNRQRFWQIESRQCVLDFKDSQVSCFTVCHSVRRHLYSTVNCEWQARLMITGKYKFTFVVAYITSVWWHDMFYCIAERRVDVWYCAGMWSLECMWCVQMFADQGLRTLCCAVREISPELFRDWKQRHHAARWGTHCSVVFSNCDASEVTVIDVGDYVS